MRNLKIDLLRGVAILLVLVLHFHLSYHLDKSLLNRVFTAEFIKIVAANGNYGVTIFFVISGFLITSLSLQRYKELGKIDIGNFYVNRFARIMPCLALVLLLIGMLNFFSLDVFKNSPNAPSVFLSFFSVLTFWHNVLMEKAGYFNYCLNIYWSLSVEEVFYLAFPLICFFFKKTRAIAALLSILIIIGPIVRYYYSDNEIIYLYGYFSCFDAIALGCCAAIISSSVVIQKKWLILAIEYIAVGLAIFIYCDGAIKDHVVLGISLMEICTAVLLVFAVQPSTSTFENLNPLSKLVCWLGKHSYELYLFHIVVLALMKEFIPNAILSDSSKIFLFLAFMSLSILLSYFIANFYSNVLNLKLRKWLQANPQQFVSTGPLKQI